HSKNATRRTRPSESSCSGSSGSAIGGRNPRLLSMYSLRLDGIPSIWRSCPPYRSWSARRSEASRCLHCWVVPIAELNFSVATCFDLQQFSNRGHGSKMSRRFLRLQSHNRFHFLEATGRRSRQESRRRGSSGSVTGWKEQWSLCKCSVISVLFSSHDLVAAMLALAGRHPRTMVPQPAETLENEKSISEDRNFTNFSKRPAPKNE